jgi:murein DD-endopeptidase MepM/ murein hydrolase activator NlpD
MDRAAAVRQEEVPGIHLQPFENPRKNATLVHTGQDVGGCLDGAGLYAIGDGFVRFIATGSDCGTLIVVEHRFAAAAAAKDAPDDRDAHLTAVYMHAGGTVFVEAGESVSTGQLLGTVGLSFSIENGGQFAHLHFGLYRGPFRVGHNYGYQPAAQELGSWLGPAARCRSCCAAKRRSGRSRPRTPSEVTRRRARRGRTPRSRRRCR